jgi:hypothetical protein
MQLTEERMVDGLTYEISKFSATKGVRMLTRLASLLGEPIGAFTEGGLDKKITGDMVSRAAKALFERLDENQAEKTVKDLLENVRCDGKAIQFDTHFQGRILHLFKVLKEVLEVQYGDFFGEITKLGDLLDNKPQLVSNALNT